MDNKKTQDSPATDADALVLSIVEATAKHTGEDYLKSLVAELSDKLSLSHAFVGEISEESGDVINTIVVRANGQFAGNFSYGLAGTPCEKVTHKIFCYYPERVQGFFPEDTLLVEMGIEAYAGVPLFDSAERLIGLLVGLDRKPMGNGPDIGHILTYFAPRAGTELERKRKQDEQEKIKRELEGRVKEQTEALKKSEELYRTLSESANDLIFTIGEDRRLTYVNRHTLKFLNAEKSMLIGALLSEIIPGGSKERLHEAVEEVFSTGKEIFIEDGYKFFGKDVWLGTKLNPIHDHKGAVSAVLGISRDITERMNWTSEIKKERDKARSYLEIAGVMLIAISRKGDVTLINRKGCEILGYHEKDIIGKNWFDNFLPSETRNSVKKIFSEIMAGGIDRFTNVEGPVLTKDGQARMVAWSNTVITDAQGSVIGSLSSGEDVTERKLRESEREKLITELQGALANIKTLKGLLPICASCKKIRDDKGYWKKIEVYIQEHSEADFSHGICPECAKKIML